jgi:hypothetical protein
MQNKIGAMYVNDKGEWCERQPRNFWRIFYRSIKKQTRLDRLKRIIEISHDEKNSLYQTE